MFQFVFVFLDLYYRKYRRHPHPHAPRPHDPECEVVIVDSLSTISDQTDATLQPSSARQPTGRGSSAPTLPPGAMYGQPSGPRLASVFELNLPLPTYEEATTIGRPSSSISLDIPSIDRRAPGPSSDEAIPPPYYITLSLPPTYEEATSRPNNVSLLLETHF